MHPDQLEVSLETVRRLVDDQFPDWRSLPIRQAGASGSTNALFRIGDGLAARFPLRAADIGTARRTLELESRAAYQLVGRTPFPTPEPVALGEPGAGYPLPWAVQTWLPGTIASDADPHDSVLFARDLASFVRDVRAIPTDGASFSGSGRGGDPRDHDTWMDTCFRNSRHLLDVGRLRRLWAGFLDLPPSTEGDVMNHGDLIPANLLVAHGRLAGVLDVGGLGPADPALDLIGAWHLLDDGPRQCFRDELGCGDVQWERGKAWAFEQAMGVVWYYVDSNPALSQMGLRTLERIVAHTASR